MFSLNFKIQTFSNLQKQITDIKKVDESINPTYPLFRCLFKHDCLKLTFKYPKSVG
jgi:hypothetical protein